MSKSKHKLYIFENKTSDEVLLINGFQHINQLIPYINELQQENQQLKEVIEEAKNKLNKDIQDLNNFSNGLIQPSELIKSLKLYLQILDKAKGEDNE